MALPLAQHQNATMTMPTDWSDKTGSPRNRTGSGFTLVEMLVATALAGIVGALTWNIMLTSIQGDIRAESRRRLHDDWKRVTSLIQSEISLSDLIDSEQITPNFNTTNGCNLLQDVDEARLKLQMHLVGTLPDILYGVRRIGSLPPDEANKWMGGPDAGVLIRCGPRMTIGENGNIEYIQGTYQQSIVLDNLDLSTRDGFHINKETSSQKLVEFSLNLIESPNIATSESIRTKTLSSGGISRINEIPAIPSDKSICERICLAKDVDCGHGVKTLLPQSPTLYIAPNKPEPAFGTDSICTNRPYFENAEITGANGNYVMNGNPTPIQNSAPAANAGVTINGSKIGRNILLGTPAIDKLVGGEENDALIGRGGNDELFGGKGNDNILPWSSSSQEIGSVSVDGGDGFDRIYLKDRNTSYDLSPTCNRVYCKVETKTGNGSLRLTSIEQIIFIDSIQNINDN